MSKRQQLVQKYAFVPVSEMPDFDRHIDVYRELYLSGRLRIIRSDYENKVVDYTYEEVVSGIMAYLQPIRQFKSDDLTYEAFENLLMQIVSDPKVMKHLRKGSKKNGKVLMFNKYNIYSLIGHLRQNNVYKNEYQYVSKREMAICLDGNNDNYRSRLGRALPPDTATRVNSIIDKFVADWGL